MKIEIISNASNGKSNENNYFFKLKVLVEDLINDVVKYFDTFYWFKTCLKQNEKWVIVSFCCTVSYKWVTIMDSVKFELNDIM